MIEAVESAGVVAGVAYTLRYMPGIAEVKGYVDRGERVEDAACREAREEVGLEVAIGDLVGVYSYSGRPVVVVVYSGRVTGGELIAGHETSEVAAFPEAEIPWADLAFPSTTQALRAYLGEGLPAAGPGGGGSDK